MYTLSELMKILNEETMKGKDQEKINLLAIEIASRVYIPNDRQTYEEFLNAMGYQEIRKEGKKKCLKKN